MTHIVPFVVYAKSSWFVCYSCRKTETYSKRHKYTDGSLHCKVCADAAFQPIKDERKAKRRASYESMVRMGLGEYCSVEDQEEFGGIKNAKRKSWAFTPEEQKAYNKKHGIG